MGEGQQEGCQWGMAGRLIGGCTVCSELLGNCFLAGTVDRTGIKYMDP